MWSRHQALLLAGGLSLFGSPSPSKAQPSTPVTAAAPAKATETWPASRPRVEVTATSQFGKASDYAPWRVVDGWASGLWCEGVAGPGLREAVTLRFAQPLRVARVEVQGGVLVSGEHFHANDVPIGWRLSTSAGFSQSGRDTAMDASAPSRGPTGLTRFTLPEAPIDSLRLQLEGVLRRDGEEHTCVSEVGLYAPGAEDPMSPVALEATRYTALPGNLAALIQAFATCDREGLARHVHFPLWWDVPEATVKAEGASVTPVTTLKYRNVDELAKRCAERPAETPRAPKGSSLSLLLEGLFVEAPDKVSVLFPMQDGEGGMRWRLGWRDGRWSLVGAQR